MKIKFMKIINYIKKYFRRFLKLEFIIICLLSVFIFPIIRPNIVWLSHIFFSKYIGQILWHEYISYFFASIVCLIIFGLITAIFSDISLWIKEYFKQKKIISSELEYKRLEGIYSFYILDLESWAKKNNLYNKISKNLWEELRIAKNNLNFRYTSYNRISLRYLLKRYRKINYFMKINTKIFKLLRNNKKKGIILRIRNILKEYIKIIYRKK
jgi:hypothetical protein